MTKINDTYLRSILPTDKLQRISIEHGLSLLVRPSGKKVWSVRYSLANGKRSDTIIGDFPRVLIREAKKLAIELQENISAQRREGSSTTIKEQNTLKSKEAESESLSTFAAIAEIYLNDKKHVWCESHWNTQKRRIDAHLMKPLGRKNINNIEAIEIKKIFDEIKGFNKYVLAKKVYWMVRDIFKKANTLEKLKPERIGIILRIEDLGKEIPTKEPRHRHPRKWTPEEIGTLMRKIYNSRDRWTIENSCCLQIAPYVFIRASELVGGEWTEIDLDRKIWYIPASRMKVKGNDRDHIVPLCTQVISILIELYKVTGGQKYIFPGRKKNTHLHEESPNRAIRRLGYTSPKHDDDGFVTHGFKSIASSELHQTFMYNSDMIEFQLAHKEKNLIKGAYNHLPPDAMLKERAEMMQVYADYLDSLRDKM